jgi:hypothetical protein
VAIFLKPVAKLQGKARSWNSESSKADFSEYKAYANCKVYKLAESDNWRYSDLYSGIDRVS